MDSGAFLTALAAGLGDPGNLVYSTSALQAAMVRGVGAYSQFRPCLRRMGTGSLMGSVSAGATQLVAAGGWFAAGDALTLEPWTANAETVTALYVARYAAAEGTESASAFVQVTTAQPLGMPHGEGTAVTKQTPGLALAAGRDTYPLPYDFRSPDQESFDMATGQKLYYHASNGFYDVSSRISGDLSGVGFGKATNFGLSGGGWPVTGNIVDNPNGIPGGGTCRPVQWRFLLSDSPQLAVSPCPSGPMLLDFYYFGAHTVDSVPGVDQEAVLQYAIYAALSSRIGALSGLIDLRMADGEESQPSKMTAGLKIAADAALREFDRLVRLRAFAVGG